MRYLSKIYFINSAHIPYAEVMLDGNVHFIGTQGVGKSTLLRAILFFYNAEKEKLGIRKQGQRTFDDFYLPTAYSYIIYQVERGDERPFSIIAFRNIGRTVFRFVDAPFNPNWIIDQDGLICNDHAIVKQRITKDGFDSSRIIDNYGVYRDIIYGNTHASLTKDLKKYSLLESAKYHNIPRIIQNVFLNERVDADFIKDTIIKSLRDEAESKIPLRDFRSKLCDFDQDYTDILLWSKIDKKGNNVTLQKANVMIEISHGIKLKESLLLEHAGFLAFSIDKTRESLPVWSQQLALTSQSLEAKRLSLSESEQQYETDKSKLDRELGAISAQIKECRELREEYEKRQIESALRLDQQESALQKKQKRVAEQLAQLKSQFMDIECQFSTLIETALMAHTEYKQEQLQQQIQNRQDFNNTIDQLIAARDKAQEEAKERFADQIAESQHAIALTNESIQKLRIRLVETQHSTPYAEEIKTWKETTLEIQKSIKTEEDTIRSRETDIKLAIKDGELEISQLEEEYRPQFFDLDRQKTDLTRQIKEEEQLLARAEGSFCQWLQANKPDWRDNIGKVASEDKVLYSTTLCPRLSENEESSFFGVDLDLSSLDTNVRSPQEIKEHLQSLNSKLRDILKAIETLQWDKDKKAEDIKTSRSRKIKALRDEKLQAIQRKAVAQQNLKLAMLQIDDWIQKQKDEVERQITTINAETQEQQLNLEKQKDTLQNIQSQMAKVLEKVAQQYQTKRRAEEKKLKGLNSEIDKLITAHSAETDQKVTQYKKALNEELAHSGADTSMIQTLENELESIQDTLRQILDNKPLIHNYLKDKVEKLDQEENFRKKKAKVEASISTLRDRRQKQKEKLVAAIEKLKATETELQDRISQGSNGIAMAEEFISSDSFLVAWRDVKPMRTPMSCDEIVKAMHTFLSEKYQAEKKLQQAVIEFKHPFSQKNIFKFPTQFESQDDYMAYVDSVEDFVVNNKIEHFQQLTSNVYTGIISQIGTEFNQILAQESGIKKIINEVKYDFSQKTFAGVIRSLDLELRRSDDPLINTLQRIHDFNDEHHLDMGEKNLFSSEDNDQVNRQAVDHLHRLMEELNRHPEKDELLLSDIFSLRFKIDENDNTTGWQENIKMVGSDGTDILVKAILNILLINVFKSRATKKNADFRIHCMMDEIGKLADENIQGILDFANARNIFIVNSSPKSHRPLSYRHLYLLTKDAEANTIVHQILTTRQAKLDEDQNNA